MLKVVNNGISLTRGDTATFRLQIKNQDGTDYEITPDDQVHISWNTGGKLYFLKGLLLLMERLMYIRG